MPRVKLILAYTGTEFAGWQVQNRERTVQGCLEQALEKICRIPLRVHGAGRTDSGVHATGQTAHFDPPFDREHIPWRRALNALLPRDIAVLEASHAPPDFHARFNARSKTYSYTLWTEHAYVLPQRRPFAWPVGSLDLKSMQLAADTMVGEFDFAAFMNVGTEVKSTVRRLMRLDHQQSQLSPEIVWRFTANGFLKQMVRNLMGCLVAVGRGKIEPEAVRAMAERRDRSLLPATAPPQGLCLEKVTY